MQEEKKLVQLQGGQSFTSWLSSFIGAIRE